ncbi:IS21 family transposase [Gordonia sp. DT30]|uniref:IS21 family transposase n=1 Tax=Gordonia sp. DT30 TaxID=3416546 RepID=UPI003CE7ACCF
MAYREVHVEEIREVLRLWLGVAGLAPMGLRMIASHAGLDRKTVRRYVAAAQAAGLTREAGAEAVTDELIGAVIEGVRPLRPNGHGQSWQQLEPWADQITKWLAGDLGEDMVTSRKPLTLTKVHELLARQGCVVPYRTLVRFATDRCGWSRSNTTVRIDDGDPGVECQIDFGYLGMYVDETGARRKMHALVLTAVYSRHMFVWLTHSQTLTAVIEGCEAAWEFFGGVFKVLIPDNMKPVVTQSDTLNPQLSVGWLDYSQHAGFVTDAARVRTPTDKPRVERTIRYVQDNFWAGEAFRDLADAQTAARAWSMKVGERIHGTTRTPPLQLFTTDELPQLLPPPATYDVPVFKQVKVHRDFHASVCNALYSLPEQWIGQTVDVRADAVQVRFSVGGRVIKTHPRMPAGTRNTDPDDYPDHKSAMAMRNITTLIAAADRHGTHIGIYMARVLDDRLPWTRMRAGYALLGLVKKYGADPVDTACSRALDFDVISVLKIRSMLDKATEATAPILPKAAGEQITRFARNASEFTNPTPLTVTTTSEDTNHDHPHR